MGIRIKVPMGAQLVVDWEQSGIDDGPTLPNTDQGVRDELFELSEWRSAAKKCQFESPEELAGASNMTAGQFIDTDLNKKWQLATACESPVHAEAFRSAWCTETDATFPLEAGVKMRYLRSQRDGLDRELCKWQKATQCDTPEQAKARLDAYQLIEKTYHERMDSVLNEWKKATNWSSPTQARAELCFSLVRIGELEQDIRAWQKATGVFDSANAINVAIADRDATRLEWQNASGVMNPNAAAKRIHDLEVRLTETSRRYSSCDTEREHLKALATVELAAWQEMAGAKDPNAAYQRFYEMETARNQARDEVRKRDFTIKVQANTIDAANALRAERDQDLLTAHAEIDRLRKAAQTLGLVSDDSRELAKVRAELHTKCREAHTWKERAETSEKSSAARGNLLEQVGMALQLNEPIKWDPLPGQVKDLRKCASMSEDLYQVEKRRCAAEKQQNIAQAGELQRLRGLLVKTCKALGVEKWDDLPEAAEDLFEAIDRNVEKKDIDLAAAQKDIADILTSQLHDVGIASAAGAVAGYFGSLVKLGSELDEVRKLLGAKIGESIMGAANRVMSTAIFPLPKPEKIESGQKWAFVMTAKGDRPFGCETFTDSSGCQFDAKSEDLASAFYLGT